MDRSTLPFAPELPDLKPISHQIYEHLRNAIVGGKLREGQRLVEAELTKAFKVSRSPVREALRILALEGFIELIPYRKATVSAISPQDVRDYYEIKAMVEGFAAFIGARRFTEEQLAGLEGILAEMAEHIRRGDQPQVVEANLAFHTHLVELVQNSRLSKIYEGLTYSIRRYSSIGLISPEVSSMALQEHAEIVAAIRRRDPEEAERKSHRHAFNVLERVMAYMAERAAARTADQAGPGHDD